MTERMRERPVRGDRSPGNLALVFRDFGKLEAPQVGARLYEALSPRVAEDAELLELVAAVPASQPPPNLLFGAVHYLLLDRRHEPLARYYADLGWDEAPGEAFEAFREFVLRERTAIEGLLRTRRVQTNVVQRCTSLVPAFAHVAGGMSEHALALVEIGPSAGLNMLWDRYGYAYPRLDGSLGQRWGDLESAVQLSTEVRGERELPDLPASIPVARRVGLELEPVDVADDDAVRWLRALIWPEHVERHERLEAAIAIARHDPPPIVGGDATELLAGALVEAPGDAALCAYATHALYQIPREGMQRIYAALEAASAERVVWFVVIEGTGREHSEVFMHRYEGGRRTTEHVANCNPHGRWIEWLG